MIEVSEEYASALVSSQITPVEIVEIIDASGEPYPETLNVASGEATEDASADVRHSCDVELVDPTGDLRPLEMEDLLAPFGTRIRIRKGLQLPNEPELITLGTYFITTSQARMAPDGRALIPVTGFDRIKRLQRPLPRSISIMAGRPIPEVVVEVMEAIDPTVTSDAILSEWTSPYLLIEAGDDAVEKMREYAAAIGAEVFVDREDQLIVQLVPLIRDAPVWILREGAAGGVVIDGELTWDGDNAYNGVVVVGQHSTMQSPVMGDAWDMDPMSLTYRYGGFGESALFIRTEKVTNAGQAVAMAQAQLQRVLGGTMEVPLTLATSHHHFVTGDVLRLELPSLGLEGVPLILERIRTPLGDPQAEPEITVRRGVEFDSAGEIPLES